MLEVDDVKFAINDFRFARLVLELRAEKTFEWLIGTVSDFDGDISKGRFVIHTSHWQKYS